jgi:HK97 gp10 family phage protein
MAEIQFDVSDLYAMNKMAEYCGVELKKGYINSVVKKAMEPVQEQIKYKAPKRKGNLANGLVLKAERSKSKTKKVYQILPDPEKSDIFVKFSIDGKRAYYPASQEYGYKNYLNGADGEKVEGKHFMRNTFDANRPRINNEIIEGTMKKLERAWKKTQRKAGVNLKKKKSKK